MTLAHSTPPSVKPATFGQSLLPLAMRYVGDLSLLLQDHKDLCNDAESTWIIRDKFPAQVLHLIVSAKPSFVLWAAVPACLVLETAFIEDSFSTHQGWGGHGFAVIQDPYIYRALCL